jgi:hypothetical protein
VASYTKNIVTDYGAPTNGTSDTSVAWESFTAFLATLNGGDDVTLTVPAHTYLFDKTGEVGIAMLPGVLGGLTVVINGTGATFTDGGDGSGFFLANIVAIRDDNTHSARIASVNPGAMTVTLLTPSQHSRFTVGAWVCMTGLDLQGFGSPPNPALFEFLKVTDINTGTGVITFSTSVQGQYLSTWPLYQPGGGATLDNGGPATIYALPETWDIDATFNGITFSQNGQIYFKGRKATFNGGGVTSRPGIVPTVNQSITFNNFDQSACFIEADKLVTNLVYNGGSIDDLTFQSMSGATNCRMTDVVVSTCFGTPKNFIVSGGSIGELRIGALAYGRTETVRIDNCAIANLSQSAINVSGIVAAGYTMSNGVIRWPKAVNGPLTWAIPGTECFFSGTRVNENARFRVLTVTEDGTDTIVTTTATGGFPNVPGTLGLRVHPCPIWLGTGNTGSADAVDLSQVGAQGKSLFAYTKRTYTNDLRPATTYDLWGQLVSININVTQAYFGAQPTLTLGCLGQFTGQVLSVDRTELLTYNPVVDLKQTGLRTITPVSVSGGQAGDTLGSTPGNIWFAGTQTVYGSSDISGEASGTWPIVEIEIITDQGLARLVPPLGLRLRG